MAIINLDEAKKRGVQTKGAVYIQNKPQIRTGKKDDFMVGRFVNKKQEVDFKIWNEDIFAPVEEHGPGIYEAELVGADCNNQVYVTVLRIEVQKDPKITKYDFLPGVAAEEIEMLWQDAKTRLTADGVSEKCWNLLDSIINSETIGDRFWVEGAATSHHDNVVGGLAHHSIKMLRILAVLIENDAYLKPHADLLTMGTLLHDVGKVFEYSDLSMGEYWYANHRVRGLEYLTEFREKIISAYDEKFYRQLQSIIIGHHGDYGDRPTTVACAIVHYIDTIESQVTELIQLEEKSYDKRVYVKDWGYLAGLEY